MATPFTNFPPVKLYTTTEFPTFAQRDPTNTPSESQSESTCAEEEPEQHDYVAEILHARMMKLIDLEAPEDSADIQVFDEAAKDYFDHIERRNGY